MNKNDIFENKDSIIRVLNTDDNKALIIDCLKRTVPKWTDIDSLSNYKPIKEEILYQRANLSPVSIDDLEPYKRKYAYKRYTIIAGILPFVNDANERCYMTRQAANYFNLSIQTVKHLLCLYLSFQNVAVLSPNGNTKKKQLTEDEKNFRWALNKFFYNRNCNSLKTAYLMMLKEKYYDENRLKENHPSIHQFKYFYRKTKKLQTYFISRNGIKSYQRNNRPLTGNGIRTFAPTVGTGMFDSTICDIYLINESNQLVGRPILTACVDAYSGLCLGYSLSWEGGMNSIRSLLLNMVCDKVSYCKKFGILINREDWDCSDILPSVFVTDKGSEYRSENFEQITELGVSIINLPSYRPELKGAIEKFFDVIQSLFKPYLKGKGLIEPDFRERGAHDYRKDACLTLNDFEKIILHCIIFYNSKKVVKGFPYTNEMINANIQPFRSIIWNRNRSRFESNLITVDKKHLALTLLPRTIGTFSRQGLKVNRLKYHCSGYTEDYLRGGTATVAYNPDDVSSVWLTEKGYFTEFTLTDNRFEKKTLNDSLQLLASQQKIINKASNDTLYAEIELAEHIKAVSSKLAANDAVSITSVRETREKEQRKNHINIMNGALYDD